MPLVPQIDDQVLALAGAGRSSLGTGGMQSKLAAARLVTQAGGSVIIASGTQAEPLTRILAGEPVGTLFLAHGAAHRARKRWIGLTARPRGHYVVDDGARRALESGSKSLLAIGIVEVVGEFEKGDVVGIRDARGQEFARGLTNYATPDARRIRGLRTQEARQALGSAALRRGRPPRQPRAYSLRKSSMLPGSGPALRHWHVGKLERDFDLGACHRCSSEAPWAAPMDSSWSRSE